MTRPPVDTEARKIGSRARAIVHYKLDSDHWDYREETGNDNGRDCVIELSEDGYWRNHKIEWQIKGTKSLRKSKTGLFFSKSIETKTLQYALGSSTAFVLFLVDVLTEDVYFTSIQDYFIENRQLIKKLYEQETLTIRVSSESSLNVREHQLQELAHVVFVDGPGEELRRYQERG